MYPSVATITQSCRESPPREAREIPTGTDDLATSAATSDLCKLHPNAAVTNHDPCRDGEENT